MDEKLGGKNSAVRIRYACDSGVMMHGAAHTHGCTSSVPESCMLACTKDKQLTTFIPILCEYLSDV